MATFRIPIPVLEFGQRISNGGNMRLPHVVESIIQHKGGLRRVHGFLLCRLQILQQEGEKSREIRGCFEINTFFTLTYFTVE